MCVCVLVIQNGYSTSTPIMPNWCYCARNFTQIILVYPAELNGGLVAWSQLRKQLTHGYVATVPDVDWGGKYQYWLDYQFLSKDKGLQSKL